jgi:hypothetical protein
VSKHVEKCYLKAFYTQEAPASPRSSFPEVKFPFRYTTRRPVEPGWYFVQSPGRWPRVVRLVRTVNGLHPDDVKRDGTLNDWRWFAGPIPEPEPYEALDRVVTDSWQYCMAPSRKKEMRRNRKIINGPGRPKHV